MTTSSVLPNSNPGAQYAAEIRLRNWSTTHDEVRAASLSEARAKFLTMWAGTGATILKVELDDMHPANRAQVVVSS